MPQNLKDQEPMTQGQFHKLHELLLIMRRENETNHNKLENRLENLGQDVSTIAQNTGHKRDRHGKFYQPNRISAEQ